MSLFVILLGRYGPIEASAGSTKSHESLAWAKQTGRGAESVPAFVFWLLQRNDRHAAKMQR
jgi:hypothetical protein